MEQSYVTHQPLPGGMLPQQYFRPGKENIPPMCYERNKITAMAARMCIDAHFPGIVQKAYKQNDKGVEVRAGWKLPDKIANEIANRCDPKVPKKIHQCLSGEHRTVAHVIYTLEALYKVINKHCNVKYYIPPRTRQA